MASAGWTREQNRLRGVTDAITDQFWCVGGNHSMPLEQKTTYRGRSYCTGCVARARAARRRIKGRTK